MSEEENTENDENNIIKILVCTDCHIGYAERDPVRGNDSINTFKEILDIATYHEVDLVLCAGDLFHDHKPSSQSIIQTMSLLRQYCLNDNPINIQLLSEPFNDQQFEFPSINYEDSNLNVGLPFFLIHGNHDDPQTVPNWPSGAPSLSAVDHLSTAGLVNYFGKVDIPPIDDYSNKEDNIDNGINVKPILLQKGESKLGLYGIGNIRDQRFNQELRSQNVNMYSPLEDSEDYFNILLIHQNRINRGALQAVPEHLFDDSIHLVIWGHEHDCRIVPEIVVDKPYRITQPGSSVATSLSEGETIPKHVGLLQVKGKQYNLTPIPLKTVRPFVMMDINLQEAEENEGIKFEDKVQVNKYLRKHIESLIDKANEEWESKFKNEEIDENSRMLPLIRLRVDYTGYEIGNPQRLGMEFSEKVANPKDLVHFIKKRQVDKSKNRIQADKPEIEEEGLPTDKADKLRVEKLVTQFLEAQKLQILHEDGLQRSVESFVEKGDTHAIEESVNRMVEHAINYMSRQKLDDDDNDDDDDILKAKEYAAEQTRMAESNAPLTNRRLNDRGNREVDSMEEEDSDDVVMEEEEQRPSTRTKTSGRGRGRGKAANTASNRKTPNSRSNNTRRTQEKSLFISDDEDDYNQGNLPRASTAISSRSAALASQPSNQHVPSRRRRRNQEVFDISSSSENDNSAPSRQRRRR